MKRPMIAGAGTTGAAVAAACLAAVLATILPSRAEAFCGFYINGAGAALYNNATLVVLMREGTRTVLAMQNNYTGPPEDFAMVVPVPVVLKEDNVKTLPHAVFDRVDKLSAPRLVEYWEEDPCAVRPEYLPTDSTAVDDESDEAGPPKTKKDLGVKIEAEFTVGEYKIVILSAKDASGLDTWLRREGYKIPAGAEPVLRPYVAAGSKFFVAKVDVKKVKKKDGRLTLSPLRFHYDSEEFSLPVRLGLLSSSGTQDLLVHILAKGTRYEVANYDNVTIPTNLDVAEAARGDFGPFYAALLDETLAKNPKAVITEYAWDANSCDPCPEPPLEPAELLTLGADALLSTKTAVKDPYAMTSGFVLTRLHARYTKSSLGEDLIFRTAPPIAGGREWRTDGKLEKGSRAESYNNFQARYAIRHPWTGPIKCAAPMRGVWGGPPDGKGAPGPTPATDIAFAPRGKVTVASMVLEDVPELGLKGPAGSGAAKPAAAAGAGSAGPAATLDRAEGDKSAAEPSSCTMVAPPAGGRGDGSAGVGVLAFVVLASGGLSLAARSRRPRR